MRKRTRSESSVSSGENTQKVSEPGASVAIQPKREFEADRARQAFEQIRAIRRRSHSMTVEEILSARNEGRSRALDNI
jgi:hypothetical protein